MTDSIVPVKVAIQGDGVITMNFESGITLGELKAQGELNPHLEYRIGGNPIDDDFPFDEEVEGKYLVGTQDAKGAVSILVHIV